MNSHAILAALNWSRYSARTSTTGGCIKSAVTSSWRQIPPSIIDFRCPNTILCASER
jgi:hypothetical protein